MCKLHIILIIYTRTARSKSEFLPDLHNLKYIQGQRINTDSERKNIIISRVI